MKNLLVSLGKAFATGFGLGTVALFTMAAIPQFAGRNVIIDGFAAMAVHDTDAYAAEPGSAAMSSGSVAVTFRSAFLAAPTCTCSHVNAVPLPCGISGAATKTAVTFKVATGGSDSINYVCIGQL